MRRDPRVSAWAGQYVDVETGEVLEERTPIVGTERAHLAHWYAGRQDDARATRNRALRRAAWLGWYTLIAVALAIIVPSFWTALLAIVLGLACESSIVDAAQANVELTF
jgi:hypothetical protein